MYSINEYSEVEIFVFKGQNENYEYFTGKDRDTLYLQSFDLEEIIKEPIDLIIE